MVCQLDRLVVYPSTFAGLQVDYVLCLEPEVEAALAELSLFDVGQSCCHGGGVLKSAA